MQIGEERRQEHRRDAVGRADRETAGGLGGVERLRGCDDAPHAGKSLGDRLAQLHCARGRNHALGGPQEERIIEKPPQPFQAVTDRGRRKVEPVRRPADVPGLQHDLEQNQKVEVGAR